MMPIPNRRIVDDDIRTILSQPLPWERFADKTVLITGANGFLPAYLVETLLAFEANGLTPPRRVIGLVRNREKAERRFEPFRGRSDFSLLVQDVCRPFETELHADFVVHAASQASPKYYGTDPIGTLSANVLGTFHALEYARRSKSERFLFFSSGDVYGKPSAIPTTENDYGVLDPTLVRSCYGEGKRVGETMCSCWNFQYGLSTGMIRPCHTYGPGMSLDDGRVFADFVADVVHGRNIVMKSDGKAIRMFCYLADSTLAAFLILLQGAPATPYHTGTGVETSIIEFAETLVGLFPDKKLQVVRNETAIPPGYLKSPIDRGAHDTTRLSQLGWTPLFSLKDGLRRTVESFET